MRSVRRGTTALVWVWGLGLGVWGLEQIVDLEESEGARLAFFVIEMEPWLRV